VTTTRRHAVIGLVLAMVITVGPPSSAAPAPALTRTQEHLTVGPAYASDFPDPSIIEVGGRYFAYSTQSGGANIPVITSGDLVGWGARGDALPVLPSWAIAGSTWAPSAARDPSGGYELFYTARDRATGLECIGRATSASPLGPFIDHANRPFLCQVSLGGSIDPYLFADNGTDYLVWKSDGAAGQPQQLWAQQLQAGDTALVAASALLLSASSSWEDGVVEGPAMLRTATGLFLYFSGNRWSSPAYAIGVVGCDTPLGPCVNTPTGTDVSRDSHLIGPGGASFFTAKDGRAMMAYAAWSGSSVPPAGRRELYLDTVDTMGTSPNLTEMLVAVARPRPRRPKVRVGPLAAVVQPGKWRCEACST
jgi:hypothetical protein